MIPADHLLAFALIAFALIIVPGPNVLFIISRSLMLRRTAGVGTALCGQIGVYVQVAVAGDGPWALAAGTARAWLARSRRRMEIIGGTGGLVMIGIGASLAVSGRRD